MRSIEVEDLYFSTLRSPRKWVPQVFGVPGDRSSSVGGGLDFETWETSDVKKPPGARRRSIEGKSESGSGRLTFRRPLIHPVPVQSIFAILALFLLAPPLQFFALFAAVAHRVPLTQFKSA